MSIESIAGTTRLPRDTTRQSQSIVYGHAGMWLHRWSGLVIVGFAIVHVVVQAITQVTWLAPVGASAPWLKPIQNIPLVHGVVFASVAYHTLYGFKLIALDLGAKLNVRTSFWVIVAISAAIFLREILRYVGL
jgi:succinate dehydrogenase/fumarate reductase cytochrome b subunit